jgi:hypothetical protein
VLLLLLQVQWSRPEQLSEVAELELKLLKLVQTWRGR